MLASCYLSSCTTFPKVALSNLCVHNEDGSAECVEIGTDRQYHQASPLLVNRISLSPHDFWSLSTSCNLSD